MTAAMYRRFAKADEQMIRAAMPRTSAADPAPAGPVRVVVPPMPLTFKIEEVASA